MGNSNRKLQLMNEHAAEMEMIRNKHEAEKKLLIEKLALQYNLEKYKTEIERLAKLDAYHYDIEKRQLEAKIRERDQFHEREKIKNEYTFKNNQKALSNEELKINHIHNENILKENNRNDNKNTEMKMDFEKEKYKIKIQEMDILMKRENEAEKNRQDCDNVRKNNENNFKCNIKEIDRKARKDGFEHEANIQGINNNYLLRKSENDNKFILKEKEINNEYDIRRRDLMIKENKDKYDFENRNSEIENKYKLENNKINYQTALLEKKYLKEEMKIKNEHELNIEESKRKTQKLEKDAELEKIKLELQHEEKNLESEKQFTEKMTQMKNGQDKEIEIIKNNHEEKMKKMENDEKEREHQRNIERMKVTAEIQASLNMINLNIMKEFKAMNEKGQENNSSNYNGNNMQFPFVFPMFGMGNMAPNNMNNSSFGFMNMMNNYQKPEK